VRLPAPSEIPLMLHIDRCVCVDCTFAEMRSLAERKKLDFKGISRETNCGMGCGLCIPYIKMMLRTGQTVFDEMLTEADVEREIRDAASDAGGRRSRAQGGESSRHRSAGSAEGSA
jgi:bacterioferritin-associated ferredoxin